jgi:hypothetical protein
MLEKFLPFLNPARSQSRELNQLNNRADTLSDSLITPENVSDKTLRRYFYFSVTILSLFILLSGVNFLFKIHLNNQKVEQNRLLLETNNLADKKKKVVTVDKKISFYKNSLTSRESIAEKTHFVLDNIVPSLVVVDAEITSKGFKVSLTGNNIYLFTQLIMAYLQDGVVSEIGISSAVFNPENKEFNVVLLGAFK